MGRRFRQVGIVGWVVAVVCGAVTQTPSASATAAVTITEFSSGISTTANPDQIVTGPDGSLWFTEGGAGKIGRITTAGVITEYPDGLPAGGVAASLTLGADGNLWFTDPATPLGTGLIGRLTTAGLATIFTTGISNPTYGIATGSDGNVWFTEYGRNVGKITPGGEVTEYPSPLHGFLSIVAGPDGDLWYTTEDFSIGRISTTGAVTPFTAGITRATVRITVGPDGALWFTEFGGIGRITTAGVVTEYAAGLPAINELVGITAGPDGALWFTDYGANTIGRITASGAITEYGAGISPGAGPQEITHGPDGNLWFTESQGKRIGRANVSDPSIPPAVTRLSGADRIATAVAISQHEYPLLHSGRAVVLSRADDFPDALAGVPLAVSMHAAILLTESDSLDPSSEAEMKRTLLPGASVVLLGGPSALSEAVEASVSADGYNVVRYAGADRDGTAVALAAATPMPAAILLADGRAFADALAAGAAASHVGGVVLLTDGTSVAPSVSAYVTAHQGVPVYAIGGTAAAADPTAIPIVGADRYETSVAVAQRFFSAPAIIGVASGVNYPDALAGGAAVGSLAGPVLLVPPTSLPVIVQHYVEATTSIANIDIYGGTASVSAQVAAGL